MPESWWILVAVGIALAALVFIVRPMRAASLEARFSRARRDFHAQRERLEVKFIHLASARPKQNGPHWADSDFDDDVAYVRNRNTGELSAFVAVTVAIHELADPPGGIGEVIGNLRTGTAVFRFDGDHWETDGRAFLNLSPAEAIRRYRNDLEIVDQELAGRP